MFDLSINFLDKPRHIIAAVSVYFITILMSFKMLWSRQTVAAFKHELPFCYFKNVMDSDHN